MADPHWSGRAAFIGVFLATAVLSSWLLVSLITAGPFTAVSPDLLVRPARSAGG